MIPTIRCCMKCTDRTVGCHSTCERYLKEKAEWEQKKLDYNEATKDEQNYKYFKLDKIRRESRKD